MRKIATVAKRIWAFARSLVVNADLIFALAGGVGLAVVLLLDAVELVKIGPDSYAKGSVPVLLAIAIALLHERRGRGAIAKTLLTSTDLEVTTGHPADQSRRAN